MLRLLRHFVPRNDEGESLAAAIQKNLAITFAHIDHAPCPFGEILNPNL